MRKKLFYIIIFNFVIYSYAQETTDKTTLFSYDIFNENDLYLTLEGSWKFDISTYASGNISSAFENFVFNQEPNLEASIWLFNKYFFETIISDETDENVFILGYQNQESLLQEVRIGNDDLEIGTYAGFTPSLNTEYSPGARAKVVTSSTQHEILTRFTNENSDTVKYLGYNSLEEESQLISNYIKEKFFILPFDDFSDVELYEMDDGSLTELSNSEYLFTESENLLYLEDNDDGNTIYLSIGSRTKSLYKDELYNFINPSDNPGISDSLDNNDLWGEYIVEIDGGNYIKLTNTGYSPFDQLGVYQLESLSDIDDIDIYLNGEKIINYSTYDEYIIIKDSSLPYNDLKSRYPFYDEDKSIYRSGGSGLNSSYILDFQELTPVANISVPDEAKENSLIVTINGNNYTNFTHNSDSGIITFEKEITTFDEIIITYEIDSSTGTGNILLSYGSRFDLNPNLTLDLSNTLSWDFSNDDYSYEADENVGSIISRGLLSYNSDILDINLETQFYASTPDTTSGYILFEYDESIIDIPVSSIDLSDSGEISLIKRDYNDLVLSYEEIKDLTIDDSGGAYTVYHSESEYSSQVIVMEVEELSGSETSSLDIELEDYEGDYSWATSFSIDILNSVERDFTFTFTDDDNQDSTTLAVIQSDVKSSSGYTTYTFDFSSDNRDKLTNIDNIMITLGEGDSDIILIKNLEFKGDSLITHNGSTDFVVTESDSGIYIETADDFSSSDIIEITSPISEVNIEGYGKINFTLTNTGLLDNSDITLSLTDNNTVYAELLITGGLDTGRNEIIIDVENQSVSINGETNNNATFYSTDHMIDSFTINFSNTSEGSAQLSAIILKEPVWNFYNQSSLDINYRPTFSFQIGDFSILENINISLENNLINSDSVNYNGTGSLYMDLFKTTLYGSIYYYDSIENIEYKVTIPSSSINSPIVLTDQFSFDTDRYRAENINIDMSLIDMSLKSSDSLDDESGIRKINFDIESNNDYLFSIISELRLTQYRSDSIESYEDELTSSYSDLIPEDILDIENNLNHTTEILLNTEIFDAGILFSGELNQDNESDRIDTNSYKFKIDSEIDIFKFQFSPSLTTYYEIIDNTTKIINLTNGLESYLDIFYETNPYKNLSFLDTFFTRNRTAFFNEETINYEKLLESQFAITSTHNLKITTPLNIFIPEEIKYSIDKDLNKNESLETSELTHTVKGTFTLNSEIKNSLSVSSIYDIEEDETTNSLNWDLIMIKELKNETMLNLSNSLSISEDETTNIFEAELGWLGKEGPLFIVPIFNKVLDSPYHYDHTEMFYLSLNDDISDYVIGLKHETILTVNNINETQFYIDFGWDNSDDNRLSLEIGLYTTIIF